MESKNKDIVEDFFEVWCLVERSRVGENVTIENLEVELHVAC